jgi:hypothetical protein
MKSKQALLFLKKKKQKNFAIIQIVVPPRLPIVMAGLDPALAPPRHCERSEAIHLFKAPGAKDGLLRYARNDGRCECSAEVQRPRPQDQKFFGSFFQKRTSSVLGTTP